MRNILVTGGTVFVSRYVAEYFANLGDKVWVLNRNTKPQPENVTLIEADRRHLGESLKSLYFDAVIDVTAYTEKDVQTLTQALGSFGEYVFISSSAVYPETLRKPFRESDPTGANCIWGDYGRGKLCAENYLLKNLPKAYILRPPYLYGPMQNLYREPFVFDCAEKDRTFILPGTSMNLQFFHVRDLCRFIDILITKKPCRRIYNVGNTESVSIREWVNLCYSATGRKAKTATAPSGHCIRDYFCFYDYDYMLDVSAQTALMPDVTPLDEGLRESYNYYKENKNAIPKKPYTEYIDREFKNLL
ncbi:MAG: NAD-dependent epimerase/dehydratase family protein [Clostridia bacterium]|nr:NAD-dependent epimerase/dehydratase family protein [Clostridia bacterium]